MGPLFKKSRSVTPDPSDPTSNDGYQGFSFRRTSARRRFPLYLAIGTIVLLVFMVILSLLKQIEIFPSLPTASVEPRAQPPSKEPIAAQGAGNASPGTSGSPAGEQSTTQAVGVPVPQSSGQGTAIAPDRVGEPVPAMESQGQVPQEGAEKAISSAQSKKEESLGIIVETPYTIYAGAFKSLADAQITLRELATHYFQGFVVPGQVAGNVAQSLYRVSQDGFWYRVFIGNFPSREQTREKIKEVIEKLPAYQLEIMKFPYAIECGHFQDSEPSQQMMQRLGKDGFFPYSLTNQDKAGTTVYRVLAGLFFSENGAQALAKDLAAKGYTCKLARR